MHSQAAGVFATVCSEWQGHFGALLQGDPDWGSRGDLGNRTLFVLRELLQLLPNWDVARPEIFGFLEAAHQASQASVSMIAGALQAFSGGSPQATHGGSFCMITKNDA